MADKIKGTVKFYNMEKKFGFLAGEDGKDHFFHAGCIEKGRIVPTLHQGDEVEFELGTGRKGEQANNIMLTRKVEDIPAAEKSEEKDESV